MLGWYYLKKVETIDGFQLESLLNNFIKFDLFVFLNGDQLPGEITNILKGRVEAREFPGLKRFKDLALEKDSPIIFLCDSGKKSPISAYKLTQEGYKNIYVFEGGLRQLGLYIKSNS